jgi:hypothetical protein
VLATRLTGVSANSWWLLPVTAVLLSACGTETGTSSVDEDCTSHYARVWSRCTG